MLTKKMIEDNLSPNDIYERYIPNYDKSSSKNYLSIFEKESNPSMHIYTDEKITGNEWAKRKFKCHKSAYQGDAYQLVAFKNGLDCKTNFKGVLQKINEDFNLGLNNGSHQFTIKNKRWKADYYEKFTDAANYFFGEQYKIGADLLKEYHVRQIKQLTYTNDKGKKSHFDYEKQSVIAFDFVVNGKHKLYVPKQEKVEKKYYLKTQTKSDIFGLVQLQNRKSKFPLLVLAEGEKDVLCCLANGINAVCLQSATTMPSRQQMRALQKISSHIVICYDTDKTGKTNAKKIAARYNLPYHELPENQKDIAEYLPTIDKKRFEKELKKTLTKWKSENNITVWEKDGCYWKKERRGKTMVIVKASNFTFENEALIIGEESSHRIVRLYSNGFKSKSFVVNTDIFTSVTEFSKFIESKGNYSFKGDKKDLYAIKDLVFKHCEIVKEVPQIGLFREQEYWVFSNALIKGEETYTPNELGIVDNVYIPSAAMGNQFHPNFQTARKYRFDNDSNLTPANWLAKLETIYSESCAYVGMGFIISSLYFDIISQQLRFFPLLNIWGKKGTGKTSLAMSLLSLFTKQPENSNLQTATYTGFLRKLEQTANIPQWFDEYNNRLPNYKLETLKNVYDLTGKTTGAKTNDSTTKQSKILTSCIITGQEAPTINEALLSRCIIVSLTQTDHSQEQKQLFRELSSEQEKGLGNVLLPLLQHREAMKANFKAAYYKSIEIINQLLDKNKQTANTRLVNNYAAILAVVHVAIDNGLTFHEGNTPDEEKEIFNLIMTHNLGEQKEYEQDNQETFIFWEVFVAMASKGIIKQEVDYDINRLGNLVYFRSNVFDEYAKYYHDVNKRKGVDKKTLKEYLKSEPYYKEETRKYFFPHSGSEKKQMRCHAFDLKQLESMGIEF